MLQQPDGNYFEQAIHEEVMAVFKNEIWEMASKMSMFIYYNCMRRKGCDTKRQQIIIIWSLKRKRYPHGRLSKYKARLYCHGG